MNKPIYFTLPLFDNVINTNNGIDGRLLHLKNLISRDETIELPTLIPNAKLQLPTAEWLPQGSIVSYVDVKLAHDIKMRYRSAYKQAVADMQAWKRHTDQLLAAFSFGSQTERIAVSNRQLAVYLYFDGHFLHRRLKDMHSVLNAARTEAADLDKIYRGNLQASQFAYL